MDDCHLQVQYKCMSNTWTKCLFHLTACEYNTFQWHNGVYLALQLTVDRKTMRINELAAHTTFRLCKMWSRLAMTNVTVYIESSNSSIAILLKDTHDHEFLNQMLNISQENHPVVTTYVSTAGSDVIGLLWSVNLMLGTSASLGRSPGKVGLYQHWKSYSIKVF